MAINKITRLSLEQLLSQAIGDDLEFETTTNIGAATTIASTELNSYDEGEDDHFGGATTDWWVYVIGVANAGVGRRVKDYTTSGGVIGVFGSNLSAESAAVTCRLHRYDPVHKVNALKRTVEYIYPALRRDLDDITLITGNILPNSHFTDWAVTTAPDKYAMQDSNITAVASTTAGTYRGGGKSMKVTTGAGGAGKYVYITSDSYPRLLDLMGQNVSFYCWASPEDANDSTIEIYTLKADTTAQTLTSTTECPAGEFTLIKLENQTLNDDLVEIQIRFKVATASKYVYFDNSRVIGPNNVELLLPDDLVTGHVSQVYVQTSGNAEHWCDDLHPKFDRWIPHEIISDGSDDYLGIANWGNERLLRLRGFAPLETLTAGSATVTLEAHRIPLLIEQAKIIFYDRIAKPTSAEDVKRFEREQARAEYNLSRLFPRLAMARLPEKRKGR